MEGVPRSQYFNASMAALPRSCNSAKCLLEHQLASMASSSNTFQLQAQSQSCCSAVHATGQTASGGGHRYCCHL